LAKASEESVSRGQRRFSARFYRFWTIAPIYANLAGEMKAQAEHIVEAMRATGSKRLIFISSMGICDEVPGERYP
jgi:hypothetical protein